MRTEHVATVVALLLSVSTAYTSAYGVCGNVAVWRNENMTCPTDNTVCADVFDTTRNWYNGTTCEEHRVLFNCICPNNMICPVDNPDYRLYSSEVHTRYTCKRRCDLNWCADFSRHDMFPMTTIHYAPEFAQRTYNKIDCRCPGHHSPSPRGSSSSRGRGRGRGRGGRRIHRAVRGYSHRWDYSRHGYVMLYVCNARRGTMADPCDS